MRSRGTSMCWIYKKIQSAFSFSDYDMKLLQYSLEAIFGEISKCIILFIYFFSVHKTFEFLVTLCLLLLLRSNTGGLHMKHYLSCLIVTFIFFYLTIMILPEFFPVNRPEICIMLFLCIIINLQIGPVHAKFIKHPNLLLVKKGRIQSSGVLLCCLLLALVLPISNYLIIGFWTVILQTLQLIAAKCQEVIKYGRQNKT